MHPGRLGAAGDAGDQLRAVCRLLAKPPRLPALRAGEGEAHRQRLLVPAAQMDLSSQSQRIPAGRIHDQLNLAIHVAAIKVAQAGLYLQPAIICLDVRLEAHPVDGDRAHVLKLDRAPQTDRHLPSIGLR